jgi:flagellin-like hook-associated protein FlgL
MYMEELGCYMTKKNVFKYLVPVGVLLAFASLANATVIAPGTSSTPISSVTLPGGGTIVASTGSQTASTTVGTDILTVTYTEWVYKESGGTLDFIIQADNSASSTDFIDQVTTSGFAGNGSVTTNVGFNPSAPTLTTITGGIDPGTGSRLPANGNVIGFGFGTTVVNPGQDTDYLIIQTNQTQFVAGTVSFQDGITAAGIGYGVAPEPNMACLLSVFAVGILGIAYRRKKVAAKNTEV